MTQGHSNTLRDEGALPTGTVTFLFSDIEGSTRLVQEIGDDRFSALIEQHHDLLRQSFEQAGGIVIRTEGDAFFAVFESARAAVEGAAASQRALTEHPWPSGQQIRVRIGLHTGNGRLGGDDYLGLDVHRAARISSTGAGGQIVISEATAQVVESGGLEGIELRDLGSHRLKDLAAPEHLYQVDVAGLATEFPSLRTAQEAQHRLPVPVSSFVGRTDEASVGAAMVRDQRLVTLTGPGGTGKTRLALRIATDVADEFVDGTFFVALAGVREEELIPTAILEAMGAQPPAAGIDPASQVVAFLAGKQSLMVLDNFEHLLGWAPMVATLLEGAPSTHVLVTSRSPLHVAGEQEIRVDPLGVPDIADLTSPESALRYAGVELFVERAVSVDPGFELTADNVSAVGELVTRLDGLPLAIELAAAATKMMGPQAVLERLGDRLLRVGQGGPSRQRTLNDTIKWSHDLLDPAARDLFERLGTFSGGAALEQIEELMPDREPFDVWSDLAVLVDNSLVRRRDVRGEPRFRMLETIRTYAENELDGREDADEIRRRHAATYLALAERAEPHLLTVRRGEWLDRLGVEHGNLLAALDWAIANVEPDWALRLVASLWRFWQMRGHLDPAAEHASAALAMTGGSTKARAQALEAAAGIAYWRGDWKAIEMYAEALELWRQIGDDLGIANAIYNAAFPEVFSNGLESGRPMMEQAEAIFQEHGDRRGLGRIHFGWANIWQVFENHEAAVEACETGLEYLDPSEDAFDFGWAEFVLAENLMALGRLDEAGSHLRSGLDRFVAAGDLSAMVLFLGGLAQHAYERGDIDRSMTIAGATQRLRDETGTGLIDADPTRPEHFSPEALANLPADQAQAFQTGVELDLDAAIAYATSGL